MTAPMITPSAYAPGALAKIANKTPMVPRPFRIIDLTWETGAGDVFTWKLEPVDGAEYNFKAGQFNMLYHYGVGEVPISISGDTKSGVLTHTSRAVGAVTQAMQKLRPGDEIGVRGPFGSDWPVALAHGKELILLTGGIGLAPLRPVIYYALNYPDKFRKLYLLYGTRTPLDILYRRELEQWQLEGQINVAITVDRASGHWQGNVGVVTNLLEDINIDAKNSMAMVCGPEIMMHFGILALQKTGLSQEQIYVSMERNMKCAIGHCGHCQWGPHFICKEGPVFRLDHIDKFFEVREL
jgi:NAD(P)H-flavin reductase